MNPSHIDQTSLRLVAAALLALAALPSRAGVAEAGGPTATRTSLTADLYGRIGPDGVMLTVGALRRWDQRDGASPVLRGRYAAAGISVGTNPAYAQGAVFAEWIPLAPLQLRAQYDAFAFYGANGALLALPSASSRFGESELDARSGAEERGVGHRLLFSPVLRAQLGPLLFRNQTDVAWYRLSDDDGWFHEWEYDTLLAGSDLLVSNRLAVLGRLWRGAGDAVLLAGPAYEVTHAGKTDLTRQRVECVVFWSPVDRLGAFARPRLVGVLGVNLQDRNREGDLFGLVGLGMDLDL